MSRPDLSRLFRRIEQRAPLSENEKRVLEASVEGSSSVPAGRDVVKEGTRPERSTLLVSGLAIRYSILLEGRRQITAIHVPGDFVDLHSYPLQLMDHTVATLTDCRFATVPHQALDAIVASEPELTRKLWMMTLLDGALHREWLVAMGALPAPARTAHLIYELFIRLRVVGLAQRDGYDFPISQTDLADVLGLSAVHMNRTLQELRSERLIDFQQGRITILDEAGLRELAQFDDRYLHLRE